MANPFDQFDAASQIAPAPSSANPFDQFDASTVAEKPVSTSADAAKGFGSGLIEGTEGLLGMRGDINRAMDYGSAWAGAKSAEMMGLLPQGQTASDYLAKNHGSLIRTAAAHYGVPDSWTNAVLGVTQGPSSEDVKKAGKALGVPEYDPTTTAGQYAKTVGSFIPGAVAAPFDGPAALAGNVMKYGVGAGLASETAGQLTKGTAAEPYARTIAGLVGGVGSDLATAGAQQVGKLAKGFVQPFTDEGQQAIAAAKLRGAFTDPEAAQAELAKNAAVQVPGAGLGEIIPGSKPTTGQLTGDLGALSLERELATKQPELAKSNPFGTGSEQQNAARTAALQGVQPTGSPEDVGNLVRSQLAKIESDQDAEIAKATAAAQSSASKVGTGVAPEDVGAHIRATLQGGRDVTKVQERQLWKAVDPDGTLALPAEPVSNAANEIASSVAPTAKPMSGEEAAIFDTASNMPKVAPFSDMTALRSRVSTAMREEMMSNGASPAYARLSQLRGSIEEAIVNACAHEAAVNPALGGRLDNAVADVPGGDVSGLSARKASVGASGPGSPGGAPTSGANSQGNFGLRNDAGGQGIPGTIPRPESQILGPGKVYYPSGSLDVNYEVMDHSKLVTSHDGNFRVNPKYPADLQPRARETAPARDQVNAMASKLQPERLGRSADANSGAPIVGPDNVVESGNGRTLAIGKAYEGGKGGDYRNWLESQGVDTKGMAKPVLVGRRVSPMSPEDRVSFAHSANSSSGLAMNAEEQAAADARLITPEGLSSIGDGSAVNSDANRTFVRSFLSQLSPEARGALMDAQGNLSQNGIRRIEAAMSSRAYGDPEYIAKAFGAADPNIRGLAGALSDASGPWMKMRQLAREGVIDPEHDVTPDLMNAVRAVIRARDSGRPVAEVLNQRDMFGGEASKLAKNLILNDKGAVGSREQIAEQLQKYASAAQKNLAGPSLFGDTVSPSQVLKTSIGEGMKGTAEAEPEMASAAMKPGLSANLDAAAAARLKKASAATRERAQIFDNGPVGQVLKKAGNSTDYKVSDATVPGKMFVSGPKGAEAVEAYRAAAGHAGPPNMNPLHDAAAESLRREAMTPEGVVDPKKFASWQSKHQDALRVLPDDLKAKFSTAAKAGEAVAEAAENRKEALDNFQKSVAGKFIGVSSPQDVTKTVSNIFGTKTAVRDMSALARQVAGNPEAKEGLRKAVADSIIAKATGTTESGSSGVNNLNASTFQKFLRDNAATIKAAGFSERELGSMQALAQDMQRGQRTLNATRLAGQSNTAQDIIKSIEKHHSHTSLLTEMMVGVGGGLEAGGLHGAALGAGAVAAKHFIGGLRNAGMAKANMLVRDAMLNPELAMTLLKKASVTAGQGSDKALSKMLVRNAMFSANTIRRERNNQSAEQ